MISRLNKKWFLPLLAVAILLMLYRSFFSHGKNPAHGYPQAPEVGVAEVIEKNVQQWNEFSGRLMPLDQVEIRPRVSGMIESIHFTNGAMVQKGDLLFIIDPRPYAAQVARAQGTLVSTQAQANLLQTELSRAELLIKDNVISKSEYDTRQNAYQVILAKLQSAQAALDAAKLNLDFTKVRSPITGRISRAEISCGNLVEAGSPAALLATVVSSHPIYADFEVDEQTFLQYAKIRTTGIKNIRSIPVQMSLFSEKSPPHIGYIESFDNRLNTTSGTIRVRAIFDNKDLALLPGLFVRIKLGDPLKTRSILISDKAIGTDQSKKFVLVVDQNNKINYREIILGPTVENLRVIKEGLTPGEKIVVNGLQRLRPGMNITPQYVAMGSTEIPTKELS